jgi:tRNA 2-thiocytidine biosynthesis protein TtcA
MSRSPEQVQIDKLFKKICRKVGTTMRDHSLIKEGDQILVGLSGGKDSMILLESLVERRSAVPFDFRISAAHIEAKDIGYQIDKEYLNLFCQNLGVELHYRIIEPDLEKDSKKTTCFICSWSRRKELFKLTKELNCNKLALGHHRNDAIETLFLNMIYHGLISSMPYSLNMFEGRVQLIRPLMDLDERMLVEYATLNNLVKVEKSCPHEGSTQRESMAQLIKQVEKLHGAGPYNMFKSMGKVSSEYLPHP